MADLANALKDEIRRFAQKEIRAETLTTKQTVAQYRREIASLKRQLQKQEKKIAFLEDQERKRLEEPQASDELVENARFSARSVAAQRKRLGLSAADYARLVGVSTLTIYNWENRKTRPRQEQLAAPLWQFVDWEASSAEEVGVARGRWVERRRSWTEAFPNHERYEWLLQQQRAVK